MTSHGLSIQTSSSLVSRIHGRVAEWIKNWITMTNCFHNEWVWLHNLLIHEICKGWELRVRLHLSYINNKYLLVVLLV